MKKEGFKTKDISNLSKIEIKYFIDKNCYIFDELKIPILEDFENRIDNDYLTKISNILVRMDEKYDNSILNKNTIRVLLRSIEGKESSKIENIETNDLEIFDYKKLENKKPQVFNILKILKELDEMDETRPSKNFVCQLQKELIEDKEKINFRNKNIYIGTENKEIKFIPIDHCQIDPKMERLLDYVKNNKSHYLIRAFVSHALFEIIHPFVDGNGRVGRVLIPII